MLKAIPDLAEQDVGTLRPIIQDWHNRALPTITTKEFSESYVEFGKAWSNVRTPYGQGKIEELFEIARQSNPPSKAVALYPGEEQIHLLAALCRELQHDAEGRGDKDFFLDCRTAGRLLGGVSYTKARRWLSALCLDSLVVVTKKGEAATHQANRYRYLGCD
jgi:hypothetical protein